MPEKPESRTQREAPAPPDHPTDSVYEEAKRCPRCKSPGVLVGIMMNHPRPHDKVETYECQNELCINKLGRWIVQINRDGSIPVRTEGPKEFEIDQRSLDFGKAQVEQTKHSMGMEEE